MVTGMQFCKLAKSRRRFPLLSRQPREACRDEPSRQSRSQPGGLRAFGLNDVASDASLAINRELLDNPADDTIGARRIGLKIVGNSSAEAKHLTE